MAMRGGHAFACSSECKKSGVQCCIRKLQDYFQRNERSEGAMSRGSGQNDSKRRKVGPLFKIGC